MVNSTTKEYVVSISENVSTESIINDMPMYLPTINTVSNESAVAVVMEREIKKTARSFLLDEDNVIHRRWDIFYTDESGQKVAILRDESDQLHKKWEDELNVATQIVLEEFPPQDMSGNAIEVRIIDDADELGTSRLATS